MPISKISSNSISASDLDLSGNVTVSGTGFLKVASGTTAQRPSAPTTANIRYNTSLGVVEFYNGSEWQAMDVYGANTYPVKYSIIAGGGGGGRGSTTYAAGGGGAGGMLEGIFFATVGTVYTTTIGGGGSAAVNNLSYSGIGNDSTISGSGLTTLKAIGGGRGSNTPITGDVWGAGQGSTGNGCGGGGGSGNSISASNFFGYLGGPGTVNQGCEGGSGMYYSPSFNGGGGGGGTGQPGRQANTGNGPVGGAANGGNGRASIVNGTTYGGGGGGGYGDYQTGSLGNGGAGGGGQGGSNGVTAANGSTNTGGGGGGGGTGSFQAGGTGGSGRILISMPTLRYTGTTTGSPTVSTSGSDTILDFTSSGSFTA